MSHRVCAMQPLHLKAKIRISGTAVLDTVDTKDDTSRTAPEQLTSLGSRNLFG